MGTQPWAKEGVGTTTMMVRTAGTTMMVAGVGTTTMVAGTEAAHQRMRGATSRSNGVTTTSCSRTVLGECGGPKLCLGWASGKVVTSPKMWTRGSNHAPVTIPVGKRAPRMSPCCLANQQLAVWGVELLKREP